MYDLNYYILCTLFYIYLTDLLYILKFSYILYTFPYPHIHFHTFPSHSSSSSSSSSSSLFQTFHHSFLKTSFQDIFFILMLPIHFCILYSSVLYYYNYYDYSLFHYLRLFVNTLLTFHYYILFQTIYFFYIFKSSLLLL